jgi:hypothetical protein
MAQHSAFLNALSDAINGFVKAGSFRLTDAKLHCECDNIFLR